MPLSFSIITPSLNSAGTIAETLESVRRQGMPEVEHLVIDGGSTDGTLDILREAEGVAWISKPDRGLSHAMNKGIAMASNEVVGWLNADDVYLDGALERVSAALEADTQALWATGRCRITDADGQEIRPAISAYKDFLLRRWSLPLFLTQNFVAAPATFVRRRGFDLVGVFDERFRYSMDYDLWLRLGRVGAPVIIDAELACFRMAEGSLSMSGFERQFAEHAQNAREHGSGHPLPVAINALTSRGIVASYRAMRALRARR